jgi:vacuolar-type H+-ATPase subunit I/STV1
MAPARGGMMSGSIANVISDFSSPGAPEGLGIGILRRVRQAAEPDPVPVQSPVDRQAELIQSVEARVRAEEREAAREQLEKALKAEQDRHREEIAALREIWVEQEARQLATQIAAAIGNLEAVLSEKAARILASVIPEALRQNAIAEFSEALGTILSGGVSTILKITGPEDILKAVKARMALPEGVVEFVPSDAVEVTLVAGDTTIQTQFSAWSERLQTLLKAEPPC